MSNISDGFDPNRGAPPPSLARTRPRDAEPGGRTPAFRGALDHASRDLDVRRRRAEASDDDVVALDVMDARERLDRSGHNPRHERRGVPRATNDDAREQIKVNDGPAYRDATRDTQAVDRRDANRDANRDQRVGNDGAGTRSSGGKRWRTTLLGEPPSGDVPVRATTGASIPPPPIPGSATRRSSMRQTLSYAVRSPASGRTEIPPPIPRRFVKMKTGAPTTPAPEAAGANATHRRATAPPRRVPTAETRVASDGEVTRLWSRAEVDAAAGIPPAPQWHESDAPEPKLLQVEAPPVRHKPAVVARVSTRPARTIVHPDNASTIVSGPLRAYAAMMSSATPSANALGSAPAATQGEAATPAPELANPAIFGEATDALLPGAAPNTIGEPVSANIDLSPAALDQLAGAGVPSQAELNGRTTAQGRVVMGRNPEVASANATEADLAMGRMGPQRAEVVVGAGANKIGLAITTVGSHVMVEALVPNDAIADTMRNELDDLRSALDQHDLELSDLTFGEATQDAPGEREPAANEDPSKASGNGDGQPDTDTAMNAGVRVVA